VLRLKHFLCSGFFEVSGAKYATLKPMPLSFMPRRKTFIKPSDSTSSQKRFINLCSEFDNSIKGKSIMTSVISDYGSGKKN
jgi:hypothetical protein